MDTRTEKDSLGERAVPADCYYGIQTLRAVENFPISGLRAHPALIRAYAAIKKACALANQELKALDAPKAEAVIKAADEVLSGRWDSQFVVDVYQAGAGTSFNMNANEVIANRASELLGGKRGEYRLVHPNDHVNMAQSTNDTFPTASHVAVLSQLKRLDPVLASLAQAFSAKGREFADYIKSARTHLQDAVPITLGQEFNAYAESIEACREELARRGALLERVALGGTAAGTGTNTLPGFREKAVAHLAKITELALKPARDPRMGLQSHQPLAAVSSGLKELALELTRISNDLRLMCSGPTSGFAEIVLPAVQPGSSIMPGKVNPSMIECLNMVCFQIIGRDLAVGLCAQAGQMDLNVMTPLAAYDLLDSIQLLLNFLPVVDKRCIRGIVADRDKCRDYFQKSPSLATLLNPKIGYAKAAELFKEAVKDKTTIAHLALQKGVLTQKELDELFDPKAVAGALD
ncbi:MAG: aspartate ammonia-lyase [Elusimicrobia bacterium]|nr:aspartate ammonia-lyase [Elusimicrobiota bacterium]